MGCVSTCWHSLVFLFQLSYCNLWNFCNCMFNDCFFKSIIYIYICIYIYSITIVIKKYYYEILIFTCLKFQLLAPQIIYSDVFIRFERDVQKTSLKMPIKHELKLFFLRLINQEYDNWYHWIDLNYSQLEQQIIEVLWKTYRSKLKTSYKEKLIKLEKIV